MRFVLASMVAVVACGDNNATPDGRPDTPMADTPIDGNPNNPLTLFDTGLCVDRACTQISPDVKAYTPQYPLWADTASKRRWFKLPAGTHIDTTDMDHWQFPVGTKFWKEFSRAGSSGDIRIETRLVMRIGPGDTPNDWFYVSYQWNDTETDTMAVPQGVTDANGTTHDIPSRVQCKGCHENLKPTRVLGFGAIQLDWTSPTAGDVNLASLVADGTLTVNPPSPGSVGAPFFPLPPDADATQKAALGYLHANCSHCHNPLSAVHDQVPMELRLLVGGLAAKANTATYLTAVGHVATNPIGADTLIIDPGHPESSIMFHDRFEAAPGTANHMPALGSEVIDPTGETLLSTWITNGP
jgi:hypothetical protein